MRKRLISTTTIAKNNQGAQEGMGELYENGWGVRQDYAEALKWYIRNQPTVGM